jgi:hypothetical protein
MGGGLDAIATAKVIHDGAFDLTVMAAGLLAANVHPSAFFTVIFDVNAIFALLLNS